MSAPSQPSRGVAIVLIAVVAVAFIGILAGLATGQVVVAGAAGAVLVIVWFGFRSLQRRGGG